MTSNKTQSPITDYFRDRTVVLAKKTPQQESKQPKPQPSSPYSTILSPCKDGDETIEEDVSKAPSDEEIAERVKNGKIEKIDGFDYVSGKYWRYPINREIRSYQYSIVHRALFENTLVVLPTGMGKTLIAAVVMYNYYLWYPKGKIIFMAPTKPLVNQQMQACHDVVGIPVEDTVELTGSTLRSKRKEEWHTHRLFFLTPQVIQNDLSMTDFPVKDIRCIVVDEAHRATGQYAYCLVIQEIYRHNKNFRILALSATPGKDLFTIRSVIQNLLISKVEYRSEESLDVQSYNYGKRVKQIVVSLTPEIEYYKEKFAKILEHHLDLLVKTKALPYYNIDSISCYSLMMNKRMFESSSSSKPSSLINSIRFSFSVSMSLAYCYDLLINHGLGCLYSHLFNRDKKEGKNKGVDLLNLMRNDKIFHEIVNSLQERFEMGGAGKDAVGHPKIAKIVELVLNHFNNCADKNTRIMIFSNFCVSVEEIAEVLDRYRPLVRPMKFVGQQRGKGLTQKQQLQIVKMFNEGSYNTLVATCVAEEGLDIGNVDLIICYDVSKSPIRLVQRMGRTGRHREGQIAILMTQGKEEQAFKDSIHNKKRVSHNLLSGLKPQDYFHHNQRLVPKGLKPICRKMYLGPTKSDLSQTENIENPVTKKGRKRPLVSSTPKKAGKTSSKKKSPESTKKRKKSRFDKFFEPTDDTFESPSKDNGKAIKNNDDNSQDTDIMDPSFYAEKEDFVNEISKDLKDEDDIFTDDDDEILLQVTAENSTNTKAASSSNKNIEDEHIFDDDDDELMEICPTTNSQVNSKLDTLNQTQNPPSDTSFNDSIDNRLHHPATSFEFSSEFTIDNIASQISSVNNSNILHAQEDECFDDEDDDLLMSVKL